MSALGRLRSLATIAPEAAGGDYVYVRLPR